MLIPLESLFDAIAGLPLHPLVVHFAVVLLPLAALGLVLLVAVPRWADGFGWLVLGGLAAGTAAAFVAKESGEALAARVGDPGSHSSWGDLLPWLAVALLVLAGAWFVLHRRGRSHGVARSGATTVAGLLAAVAALVVTGVTVVVGHTGAQAAWGDVTADTEALPTASAPASPGSDGPTRAPGTRPGSGTATPVEPATPTAGANTYTMAEVARHAGASSCWTAIGGTVYDVTQWIGQHPGGQRAILGLCGQDGTAAFSGQHGGERRPESELKQFRIGTLG